MVVRLLPWRNEEARLAVAISCWGGGPIILLAARKRTNGHWSRPFGFGFCSKLHLLQQDCHFLQILLPVRLSLSLSLFLLLTKICFHFNTVTFFALCYINDDYDRFYWIGVFFFFFYCKLGASINTIWLKRSICDLILQNFHSQTRIFSQSIRVGSPIWRHLWQMH